MTENTPQHKLYPMMPLRDLVIFPHMVAPLIVGRGKSIKALEHAMSNRVEIFLSTQLDSSIDEPQGKDVHPIGTIANVLQLLRLPDGTIKALVEGKQRARIIGFVPNQQFFMVQAEPIIESSLPGYHSIAYRRELHHVFKEFGEKNKKIPSEVITSLEKIEDPAKFIDVLSSHLPLHPTEKQQILATVTLEDRFQRVISIIQREIEIESLEVDIRSKVKKKMEKNQRDYYLSEQIKVIKKEIGDGQEEAADELNILEKAIKKKKLSAAANEKAMQELKKLKLMPPSSAEATVVRNYIDCILSLPWKVKSAATLDIVKAEEVMNEDHFGLTKPKERILEYLAVQAQVKKIKGPILCLVGPPGVGKTSLCKSVARSMNRKFVRLSLGGVRDEAEIRGHRRTYIGAMPGKIIQSLQKVKVNNPVFCLDEVDKMSTDFRGDPSSALLEVLDPEQNGTFNDHYLDLDYDLSDVFFITTANSLHSIPAPLQDRMEIIKLDGYTEEDKLLIGQDFLVPKQMLANGFKDGEVIFTPDSIMEIVRNYTREAGVRNLERNIASVYRKIARERLKSKQTKPYKVNGTAIVKYLGTPKYRFGLAEDKDAVGLSTGLAWTEVGGELLQIETVLMPGSGKLTITGKLGDVMQESAQAALSYVRSRSARLGIATDFYQKLDIHVHVPEGAIPKDGPSAGITMTTSIVSALLKVPVRKNLAMTGEVTLRGRILPIGGLTEKLLAARRGNISHVLIPKDNERNLKDVPAKILKSLTIELVDHVDDVLTKALVLEEGCVLFKDCADPLFCPDIILPGGNSTSSRTNPNVPH
ncbi:MAG: endopeptidase La [Proteobacteria bacterium]|nr:endopeptidase La [Desulfobulbaceae bacterium]MBU4152072.1 endopeptidase La [Pseudomonadota bacterium]